MPSTNFIIFPPVGKLEFLFLLNKPNRLIIVLSYTGNFGFSHNCWNFFRLRLFEIMSDYDSDAGSDANSASYQGSEPGSPRGSEPGSPRGSNVGSPRGSDVGSPRGSEAGSPRGSPRGSESEQEVRYTV